jgi:hypothetical protein
MVYISNNHLSIWLIWRWVKCATKHIDTKLYIVKEIVRNHIKSIEQVLTDPLTKDYHPECLENTHSTWVYGKTYDF